MHVAVITGTSRGLGEALARRLVSNGAHLLCLARRFTPEQQQWAESNRALLLPAALEQLDPEGAAALAANVPVATSSLVYISNAATIRPIGRVASSERESLVTAFQTNVVGTVVLSEAIIARGLALGASISIVNISSGAARRAISGWSVYCASKAATDMYFECAALDHPAIESHRVDPLAMDTGMQAKLRESEAFPLQQSFRRLKIDGKLPSAEDAAKRVLGETIGIDWPTAHGADTRRDK